MNLMSAMRTNASTNESYDKPMLAELEEDKEAADVADEEVCAAVEDAAAISPALLPLPLEPLPRIEGAPRALDLGRAFSAEWVSAPF